MCEALRALTNSPSTYPQQLAELLQDRWTHCGYDQGLLPDRSRLMTLLDGIYQASLLREESETIRCRIFFHPATDFTPDFTCAVRGLQVLHFENAISYSPHNLRKLAAAAGYQRSVLGVEIGPDDQLRLWGLIVTGANWLNGIQGSSQLIGTQLPGSLVLHALGPGHVIAAAGFHRVLESLGGQVLTEGFDPFLSNWLPQHFASTRNQILTLLQQRLGREPACQVGESFVKEVAQSVVRRALSLVRSRSHGGTLIFVPDDCPGQGQQWFRFRAKLAPTSTNSRFRELLLRLLHRVVELGESQQRARVSYLDYIEMNDAELLRLEAALIEFSHLMADFMSVDGCLVVNHSFVLIGFGAEILGDSHVLQIERALDLEAEHSVCEAADESGTRHRSAYRLVQGKPDTVAIVVSQDGGVRFVSNHRGKLTYWPYLP